MDGEGACHSVEDRCHSPRGWAWALPEGVGTVQVDMAVVVVTAIAARWGALAEPVLDDGKWWDAAG